LVRLGRRVPVKRRANRYSALRTSIASPRVTVEAWTVTSTSFSFATGCSTSATRSASGGPYRSWMTALMRSPRLAVPWAALDRRAVAPRPSGPVELSGSAATRPGSSGAASRNHPAVSSHEASAEVCGVELNAPDRLVHRTELGHGEGRADEGSRDA